MVVPGGGLLSLLITCFDRVVSFLFELPVSSVYVVACDRDALYCLNLVGKEEIVEFPASQIWRKGSELILMLLS